ncbi:hypothetical protein B0H14DRAFT_2566106 [Mycena olivaceomarginata]|nr:hypothetical protein B0H14DRAFT_2566106 [Mycena olivaceomarginata]
MVGVFCRWAKKDSKTGVGLLVVLQFLWGKRIRGPQRVQHGVGEAALHLCPHIICALSLSMLRSTLRPGVLSYPMDVDVPVTSHGAGLDAVETASNASPRTGSSKQVTPAYARHSLTSRRKAIGFVFDHTELLGRQNAVAARCIATMPDPNWYASVLEWYWTPRAHQNASIQIPPALPLNGVMCDPPSLRCFIIGMGPCQRGWAESVKLVVWLGDRLAGRNGRRGPVIRGMKIFNTRDDNQPKIRIFGGLDSQHYGRRRPIKIGRNGVVGLISDDPGFILSSQDWNQIFTNASRGLSRATGPETFFQKKVGLGSSAHNGPMDHLGIDPKATNELSAA